jgi:hypothetical protein
VASTCAWSRSGAVSARACSGSGGCAAWTGAWSGAGGCGASTWACSGAGGRAATRDASLEGVGAGFFETAATGAGADVTGAAGAAVTVLGATGAEASCALSGADSAGNSSAMSSTGPSSGGGKCGRGGAVGEGGLPVSAAGRAASGKGPRRAAMGGGRLEGTASGRGARAGGPERVDGRRGGGCTEVRGAPLGADIDGATDRRAAAGSGGGIECGVAALAGAAELPGDAPAGTEPDVDMGNPLGLPRARITPLARPEYRTTSPRYQRVAQGPGDDHDWPR